MAKPRVFISHSARDDARALTLLDALEHRLKGEGFEVLLDRKGLQVGDAWEHKIATWLDACHGAVVLFTTKALESDYVKFEVSNLLHRWRRSGGPAGNFPLLPALVEPLTEEQLKEFYGVINMWAIQRVGPANDDAIIQALVEKLEGLKGGGLSDDADERLKGHLAAILKRVQDDKYLTEVARRIGIDTTSWPAESTETLVADALVSSSVVARWDAVRLLQPRLLEPGLIRQLFDLLMPCWVGPESARALDAVTIATPGSRCALVNGRAVPFTAEMYLARAKSQRHLAGDVVNVVTNALGTDVVGELRTRVRELLKVQLKVDESDPFYPTTLQEVLDNRSDDQPVIVSMAVDATSLSALPAVAATSDLKRATFLALIDPPPVDTDIPNVTVLHPLLPKTLEGAAYKLHKDYDRQLQQLEGTPKKP